MTRRLHAERREHMGGERIGEVTQVDSHVVTLNGEGVVAAVRRGDVAVDGHGDVVNQFTHHTLNHYCCRGQGDLTTTSVVVAIE